MPNDESRGSETASSTSIANEIIVPHDASNDNDDESDEEDIPVAHAVVLPDDEEISEPECSAEAISGPVEGTPLLTRSNCSSQNLGHMVESRCYQREYQTGAVVIFVLTVFLAACVFIVEEFGDQDSGSSSAGPPRTAANTSSVSLCVSEHATPTVFMVGSDAQTLGTYQTGVTTGIENLMDITTEVTAVSSVANEKFSPLEAWGIDLNLNEDELLDDVCSNDSQATMFISNSTLAATALVSDYLMENTPQRMSLAFGDNANRLKVFMILREPVAASQAAFYSTQRRVLRHHSGRTRRDISFQTHIQQQLRFMSNCGSVPKNASRFCTDATHRYLEKGLYGAHIQSWLEYFRPEQVTLVSYDLYLRDSVKAVSDTAKILGIGVRGNISTEAFLRRRVDAATHPCIEKDLDDSTLQKLISFFSKSNHDVYKLIEANQIQLVPANEETDRAFLEYPSRGEYPYRDG